VVFFDIWKALQRKILGINKKAYIWAFFTTFFTAFIMAHVIKFTYSDEIREGFQAGFWMWAAFYLAPEFSRFKFEHSPFKLFLIEAGFHFFEIAGMGVILALAQ
jgi:hypothetical protein